jgi:hypothetical protein
MKQNVFLSLFITLFSSLSLLLLTLFIVSLPLLLLSQKTKTSKFPLTISSSLFLLFLSVGQNYSDLEEN